jgi:hypothetical protein
MDAGKIWRAQIEAGENGNVEESFQYFDNDCVWKLITSDKIYNGREAVEKFIKSGFMASMTKEKPDIIAEFSSSDWGTFEYISRGTASKNAVKFSSEVETGVFARLGMGIRGKLFNLLLTGKKFEIRVCFVFHINANELIDEVHEYVGTRKIIKY